MSAFDMAAALLALAAACGYLNFRLLHLPATSGTLALALLSSLAVVGVAWLVPSWDARAGIRGFVADIDFNQTLMRGFLSFLLFAGALHVDLGQLWQQKWTVAALSTVGVVISTLVVGGLTWWTFGAVGIPIPFTVALVFGALISPTDPIAVMGLLRELNAPAGLESLIAGESLFNDGVGVVVFLGLVAIASPGSAAGFSVAGLALFFVREVMGGAALGLLLGYVSYRALKSVDDHPLELLITLALAMGVYAAGLGLGVSAPIAVVVAGLLIGNPGRQFAMSQLTCEHVDAFWSLIDYVLNAVLFLLLGLQVLGLPVGVQAAVAGVATIPIALLGRAVSVSLPVLLMRRGRVRGLLPILTWSGLRGGISVALALSLPEIDGKPYLLAATYAVVIFSILVQGLTTRPLLVYYGVGTSPR